MKYPVTEIFYTIQGEGHHSGRPSVFVRLAGCNYKCSWCDTDFPVNFHMDAQEIAKKVKREFPKGSRNCSVVITGGEPMMHDLEPLLVCLDTMLPFPFVEIETNGAFPDKMELYRDYAWVTCSPKLPDGSPSSGWVGFADCIKLVDQGQDLSKFICKGGNYYLQPLYVEGDKAATHKNFMTTISRVKENPAWRLSLQTQKWVGIR